MDDLISRAEAIDAVEKLYRVMLLHTHDNDLLGKIVYGLEHLPSAQPEIIRCKDCKWFGEAGCAIWIVDDSDKPTEDDYCSYAERRTG